MVSLKPILDSKLSKGEGETLITHDECQQELKEGKIEFALVK